jgi:hypothetical protein
MPRSACRTCGLWFGSLSGFDRHLRWSKVPPWVTHLPPGEVGLVESGGVWKATPYSDGFRGAKVRGIPTQQDGGISRLSADVEGCVASSGVS